MSKSLRVQMIGMLAVGGLIGYAIASRQTELTSKSHAAEAPHAPIVEPVTATTATTTSACLSEPTTKSELLAMADKKDADILVAQADRVSPASANLAGTVQAAGGPIAGSEVTLYIASDGSPLRVAQAKTDDDGAFRLDGGVDKLNGVEGKVFYVVAKGGTPKAAADKGPNDALVLMTLLGTPLPKSVTINELTTVASTFTAARFINGESISGKSLGLRIAAGNTPNLVDPVTGGWGKVLVDPLNSYITTTMANLDTLGSLITASVTVANDDWHTRFFKAATPPGGATPKNTLEAMAGIARAPWAAPKELYALFDEAYPQPKDGARRSAPFVPYLAYVPDDFALSL